MWGEIQPSSAAELRPLFYGKQDVHLESIQPVPNSKNYCKGKDFGNKLLLITSYLTLNKEMGRTGTKPRLPCQAARNLFCNKPSTNRRLDGVRFIVWACALFSSSHYRAEPHKQGIYPCSCYRRQLGEAPTSSRACRACCPRAGATFQLSQRPPPCALVTPGPAAEQGVRRWAPQDGQPGARRCFRPYLKPRLEPPQLSSIDRLIFTTKTQQWKALLSAAACHFSQKKSTAFLLQFLSQADLHTEYLTFLQHMEADQKNLDLNVHSCTLTAYFWWQFCSYLMKMALTL